MVNGEFDHLTVNDKLTMKYQPGYSPFIDLETIIIGSDPILQINEGIRCLKDVSAYGGALMTASVPGVNQGTGGGCVQIGHGFQRSESWNPPADPPRINLTDYPAGFNTLYITAGSSLPPNTIDSVLADMKLRNLTANGRLNVNTIYPNGQTYVGLMAILPLDDGFANGNWANPWGYVTAETVYYKSLDYFGCARELSDTPMERKFKT